MEYPSIKLLSASALALLALSCGPTRTTATHEHQSYDPVGRCGGFARHWYNGRNVPADGVLANELQVTRSGNLIWNGAPINVPIMQDYAARVVHLEPPPQLGLVVDDGAPCSLINTARQAFAAYCASASCTEFSPDEWKKYSDRFVVYSPSQK